jgi:putative cardiolipin synthase
VNPARTAAAPRAARAPFAAGLAAAVAALTGCATVRVPVPETPAEVAAALERARETSVFGPAADFEGSGFADVGKVGLYPVRDPPQCEVAVLASGEGSFATRLHLLKSARRSIRIQALEFHGDESGQRIAEILKQKKAEGLDVRVIVDGVSNLPSLQAQWMYFDLKQHGIEVEGYESLGLQWINEVPVPRLMPHYDPERPNKRFHEKLWLIDAETPEGAAITGGLNVGNAYFRVDPGNPKEYWRDQDVAVRGDVLQDLVAAFERTFGYLVAIKQSRGIFNTNLYWDATRAVLDKTGKLKVSYKARPPLVERVAKLEAGYSPPEYRPSRCRFLHNRPRFEETYIVQAYLKLIAAAQREVLIANAYFVPTPAVAAALRAAARRCVRVRLVTNSPDTNDLPEITLVGRGHYLELLAVNETPEVAACADSEAGIRIWEWLGRRPDDPVQQGTMHSKFAVFDRRVALVGSYNLDPRSERLNSETGLVFEEPALAERLAVAILDGDLSYSRRISAEEAASFQSAEDVVTRYREKIGRLFEGQL